jgi:bifunctional DNA-binding transcriptional regulator/antitoxin component of YhaV-PrlF toxin-antitoxin module
MALLEETASLTSQNQITIPAPIRRVLKLQGGRSKISFSMRKDGTVILAKSVTRRKKPVEDSALGPFLKLLDDDMRRHPERIQPMPVALYKKALRLVRKVKVDLYAPLPDED